jgi:hypothetical protein
LITVAGLSSRPHPGYGTADEHRLDHEAEINLKTR